MLRLATPQLDFWDQLLPVEARRLSPELQAIDTLLDDARFLAPFAARFPSPRGRRTIPMETYLRLMVLKRRYQLGYETLVAEVTDSVGWRRFCRIRLCDRVPDASTLIKLTNGPCRGLADEVHTALVQTLVERKVLRGRSVRVDTTVIEADVHFPTDAQLLADGVRVITRTIKRLGRQGMAAAATFRNVGGSVAKRLRQLGQGLKQRDAEKKRAHRERLTRELLTITRDVVRRAWRVQDSLIAEGEAVGATVARGMAARRGQLQTWLDRTQQIIDQTTQVLQGTRPIPNRLISLFDPDARPIRKGNLRRPTEFGYKVSVADDERGFVTAYAVLDGNPSDTTALLPAIEQHIERVGRAPREVATDRGMARPGHADALRALGVQRTSLPKTGPKTAAEQAEERSATFRRLQRFRAGGEGRISVLKRRYGWRRSAVRGRDRVEDWVGWGAVTHNLVKYARLQA